MANIGYATLSIIPTARGIGAAVTGQIVGPIAAAGRTAGNQAGAGIRTGITSADYSKSGAGIVGPVAAAGRSAGTQAGSAISTGIASADYSKAATGIGQNVGSALMSGLGSLAKAGGIGAALFGTTALKSGLDRLTTIEDATNSLKTIMGDATQAGLLMEQIKKTVTGTPFNLDQFATAGKNLVAMGVSAEKVPGYLTAIGEAAAASGKGSEGVGQLTDTFGKMAAQGQVSLDQIWSISNAGVPALQILANGFGLDTAAMKDMISAGAVPAGKAMDILTKGIVDGSEGAAGATRGYAGTMAGLRTTFTGALGGMKAAVARFGAAFLGPWMPIITHVFGDVGTQLDVLTPKISAFSARLASGDAVTKFTAGFADIPALLERLKAMFAGTADLPGMVDRLKSMFADSDTGGGGGGGSGGLVATLQSFGGAVGNIGVSGITVLSEATNALATALGFLADHSELVVPAILAVASAYAVGGAAQTAWQIGTVVKIPAQYAAVAASWAQTRALAAHTAALNANTLANGGSLPVENASALSRMRTAIASGVSTAATWVGVTAINAWTFATSGNVLATVRATAATIAHTVASKIAQGAMLAWTAAQWLLNAAMSANPLGLIVLAIAAVVAIIVVIATKTTWFQTLWSAAWAGIQIAVSWVWNSVLQPFFAWWIGNVKTAGEIAMWLWHNIIEPVFSGIGAAISAIWTGVIKPQLDAFGAAFTWVSDQAGAAKDWVVSHLTELVGFVIGMPGRVKAAASGLWDGITDSFRTAINWLISHWNNFSLGFDFTIPVVDKHISFTIDTPNIPLLAGGGVAGRDRNGRLWGPGTPTSDSILGIDTKGIPTALVSTDEGVVKAAAMDAGGDRVVAALNAGWVPSAAFLSSLVYGGGEATGSGPGLPALATGGKVTGGKVTREQFIDQVRGIEGAKYDFGGWGKGWQTDCSGAQAKAANLIAYGDTETGGRFGTSGMAKALADRGALDGLGGPDEYSVGWKIGGPGGGHAGGTAPGGTGFEMGGARGNGQWGGGAALANNPQFTAQKHFPASMFAVSAGTNAAITPAPNSTAPSDTTAPSSTAPSDTTGTGGEQKTRLKSFEELGKDFGGIAAKGILETFGLDGFTLFTDPGKFVTGDTGDNVRVPLESQNTTTNPAAPEPDAVVPSSTTGTGTGDANTAAPVDPTSGRTGSALYSYDIARVARDMGMGEAAAVIGNAVGLVETELKMYANSTVPESLSFPHDAVGSDHDSLGVFQQRASWGSIADRMDSPKSAGLFFNALKGVPGWERMDPGAAAQAVQRSAFPDKYAKRMADARGWVGKAGLFDTGGMLAPGGVAVSMLSKPEPLLPADKWDIAASNIAAVDRLVSAMSANSAPRAGGGGGRGGGDTYIGYGYSAGEIADEWQRRQWSRTRGYDGRNW